MVLNLQSSVNPPHFEFVIDGGREHFEVGRGAHNLWRTILLFLQHVRLANDGQISNVRIDAKGINISSIFE